MVNFCVGLFFCAASGHQEWDFVPCARPDSEARYVSFRTKGAHCLGLRKTGMDRALHTAHSRVTFPVVCSTSFCSHSVLLVVDKSLCKKPQMDALLQHTSQSKQKLWVLFAAAPVFHLCKACFSGIPRVISFANDSEALLSLEERLYNENYNIPILY